MRPLHVVFRLATPMRAPEAPIHLDALLAWSAVHATGIMDLEQQERLPLEKYHASNSAWVWKASQLVFEAGHRQALPMTRRLDIGECAQDQGIRFDAPRLNVLTPGTGPYKSYSFLAPLVAVAEAHAWCVGDQDAIRDLLARVTHVGKLARIDCGRVASIDVLPDDDPTAERWTLRTMPDSRPGFHASVATLTPPYWRRESRVDAWEPGGLLLGEIARRAISA